MNMVFFFGFRLPEEEGEQCDPKDTRGKKTFKKTGSWMSVFTQQKLTGTLSGALEGE